MLSDRERLKKAETHFEKAAYSYAFLTRLAGIFLEKMPSNTLRILDIGCGDCRFVSFLQNSLPTVTNKKIEVYGFDVREHGYKNQNKFRDAFAHLTETHPDIDWQDRITAISHDQSWPYQDGFFDLVLSNQVLEHVHNHDLFMAEQARVLREDGRGIHNFPPREVLFEWHVRAPMAHKTYDWLAMRNRIRWAHKIGLGDYKAELKKTPDLDFDDYLDSRADYILKKTNYIGMRDIGAIMKQHGLRHTWAYTPGFYNGRLLNKLGNMAVLPAKLYPAPVSSVLTSIYKRIGSVICVTRKPLSRKK